jgi:hypothetical protein
MEASEVEGNYGIAFWRVERWKRQLTYVHVWMCVDVCKFMYNVHSKSLASAGCVKERPAALDVRFAGSDLKNEKTISSFHWMFLQINHQSSCCKDE